VQVGLEDDPGWAISWRKFLWLLIPTVGLRRQLKRAGTGEVDGVLMLRQVFVSFCLSIALFGVVLAVLYPSSKPPADPPIAVAIGLLVLGGVSFAAGQRAERPLNCESDVKLAGSYRTRFFLRMAFSQAAALFGFVGFFLTFAWWTYPIGATITAIGYRRAAPTAWRLASDQQELSSRGCARSLIRALRQPYPPRAR